MQTIKKRLPILLFLFLHQFPVGRQPVDARPFILSEPLRHLVLLQFQMTALHMAEIAVHGQVKGSGRARGGSAGRCIILFHRLHQSLHYDVRFQFLPYFPLPCLLGRMESAFNGQDLFFHRVSHGCVGNYDYLCERDG